MDGFIILCICYILITGIVYAILEYIDNSDLEYINDGDRLSAMFLSTIWPLWILAVILISPAFVSYKLTKFIIKKINEN